MSSLWEATEIVYHCQCRRFVIGSADTPCICHECGKQHVPTEDYGGSRHEA